jgi:hypothetical protein
MALSINISDILFYWWRKQEYPVKTSDLLQVTVRVMMFNATFNNIYHIVVVSFIGGGNRSTRRKPATSRKSLTNIIT